MQLSNIYKAPKGLIKISAEIDGDTIKSIAITGDFFMIPENSLQELEDALVNIPFTRDSVLKAVSNFYAMTGVVTPMLSKDDIINAIIGAKPGD